MSYTFVYEGNKKTAVKIEHISVRHSFPVTMILDVTPELAEKFLIQNTRNRKLRSAHLKAIVRELKEGKWQFNGDALRFDSKGTLVDGQHRLHAILLSGVTAKTLVMFGLAPEVYEDIDKIRSARKTTDYVDAQLKEKFAQNGLTKKAQAAYASIAGLLQPYYKAIEEGSKFTGDVASQAEFGIAGRASYAVKELDCDLLMKIASAVSVDGVTRVLKGGTPQSLGAGLYILAKSTPNFNRAPELAFLFFQMLVVGVSCDDLRNSAVLHLREELMLMTHEVYKEKHSRNKHKYVIGIMIIAWNHFISNKTMKTSKATKFNWNPNKDEFPVILKTFNQVRKSYK